eukprot:869832-Rhodomonas_salina.1
MTWSIGAAWLCCPAAEHESSQVRAQSLGSSNRLGCLKATLEAMCARSGCVVLEREEALQAGLGSLKRRRVIQGGSINTREKIGVTLGAHQCSGVHAWRRHRSRR